MKKYKEYQLYYYGDSIEKILEKVIDKNYQVEEKYKNDRRTYVAKIRIEDKVYILKRTFQRNKLKKIIGVFRKNNSIETFENINRAKKNIEELADIYGVGLNKKLFVEDEFFLMECIDGEIYIDDEHYLKILEVLKKIHNNGYYHGDSNPYNFLFDKGEKIHIVDTKMKKMYFGNYRAHYDMLILFKYFREIKPEYPYEKNIFYWMAFMIRNVKNRRNKK